MRISDWISDVCSSDLELSIGDDESDLVRAIRQSSQQSASQAGQQIVSKNLNLQPTITVRPGWPLRVLVPKDLTLRPWGWRRERRYAMLKLDKLPERTPVTISIPVTPHTPPHPPPSPPIHPPHHAEEHEAPHPHPPT